LVAGAVLVPPRSPPEGGGLPACEPRLLTPFEVSGSVDPVLEDPEELEPLPVPRLLESLEVPRDEPLPEPVAPEEPMPELLPDEDPVPEDEATSTPRALAVLLSRRPVACRLLDFWNSRSALCVFGPMTPSSGPGSMPLLFNAAWTSLTFSFDMLWPALRPPVPSLPVWPRSVFMSLDDEPELPRWLLLPAADGSLDFCDSLPLRADPAPLEPPACAHACGAITNTAPLSMRLDNTVACVFFMSPSLLFFRFLVKTFS
jgi:hypothetical protein